MNKQTGIYILFGILLTLVLLGGILGCVLISADKQAQINTLTEEIDSLKEELEEREETLAALGEAEQTIDKEETMLPSETPQKEPAPSTPKDEEAEQEQSTPDQPDQPEENEIPPTPPVAGESVQYFLTEFDTYAPESDELRISEEQAKKIAQIGFEESARRIASEGTENIDSQRMELKQICANNYFTRKGTEYDKKYTNIFRMCYIFTRTNEMGCGVSIYIDATTGLIIGGYAFGD